MRLFEINEVALKDMKSNCKRNVGVYSPRIMLEVIDYFENKVKVLDEERGLLLQQIECEVDRIHEDQAIQ